MVQMVREGTDLLQALYAREPRAAARPAPGGR